jgi:hypothetical protein
VAIQKIHGLPRGDAPRNDGFSYLFMSLHHFLRRIYIILAKKEGEFIRPHYLNGGSSKPRSLRE